MRCSDNARVRHASDICKAVMSTLGNFNHSNRRSYTRILVDDRHRIIYCPIGKTGSTSIKTLMLSQSTTVEFDELPTFEKAHSTIFQKKHGVKLLATYPIEEIHEKFRTYTKLIVVRHPFERLLSAYKDKFIKTPYAYRRLIHGNASRYRDSTGHINVTGFLNMLSRSIETDSNYIFDHTNKHWNLQHEACHMCFVEYDYIAKVETFSSDQEYILDLFGAAEIPHRNKASGTGYAIPTVSELLDILSNDVIKILTDYYRLDFDLFGYSVNITRDMNGQYMKQERGTC